jgi:branched-chain amino acid transport system permease protein
VTGDNLTMKAFVIVLLGGLGSMHGALVAAIVLGVAESVVSGLIAPGYRDAVSFFLLLAILLIRPRGLFGNRYRADAKV